MAYFYFAILHFLFCDHSTTLPPKLYFNSIMKKYKIFKISKAYTVAWWRIWHLPAQNQNWGGKEMSLVIHPCFVGYKRGSRLFTKMLQKKTRKKKEILGNETFLICTPCACTITLLDRCWEPRQSRPIWGKQRINPKFPHSGFFSFEKRLD